MEDNASGRGLPGALWHCAPLLLGSAMLFWAGNSIVGRAMVGIVPPVTLAFLRWTFAFLLVTPVAWPPPTNCTISSRSPSRTGAAP